MNHGRTASKIVLTILLLIGPGARAEDVIGDILRPFARNVVPDPRLPGHRDAFRLYVRTYFGGSVHTLDDEMITKIMTHLERHPEAAKDKLGSAKLIEPIEPVDPDLAEFTRDLHAGYARLRQILTNPAANVGVWRKAKWDGTPVFDERALHEFIATATPGAVEAVTPETLPALFSVWLGLAGVAEPARRAIVFNVAHYAALSAHDPRGALRANDRAALLNTLTMFAATRARYLRALGMDVNLRAAAVLRVNVATDAALDRRLALFRAEAPGGVHVSAWTLRPLSEAESALRSLLAHDCATQSYFERAFDPAFYYFTRTETSGHSAGHLTVVLGAAWHGVKRVRTAFLDKVQGVASLDLPREIEALRQITARAGYDLVIPTDLGDVNGLTNTAELRDAIKALPAYSDSSTTYRGFRPARTRVTAGRAVHSRAFRRLKARVVLPRAASTAGGSIEIFNPVPQTRPSTPIDLPQALNTIAREKYGGASQQIYYLDAMDLARSSGLPVDPEYDQLVERWRADRTQPLDVRFHLASRQILRGNPAEILNSFDTIELRTLLANWTQSPRMRSALRDLIWTMSPYLRGENQILTALGHDAELSENARTYLGRALLSPPMQDAIRDIVEARRPSLPLDFVRACIYFEAFLTAREDGAVVTAELRRAAITESRRLLPTDQFAALTDVQFIFGVIELLARPDLRVDAAALEAFFVDHDTQPKRIAFSRRLLARSNWIALGGELSVIAGTLIAVHHGLLHGPWPMIFSPALSIASTRAAPYRRRAYGELLQGKLWALELSAGRLVTGLLLTSVRHCEARLTNVEPVTPPEG